MDDCYLCKVNPHLEKKIRECATRNAHRFAIEEANRGLPGLTWCETQTAFFPKIFQHEEKRYRLFLTEKDMDKRLSKQTHQKVCCQHSENVGWYSDGFHQKVFQKTVSNFIKGKWSRERNTVDQF